MVNKLILRAICTNKRWYWGIVKDSFFHPVSRHSVTKLFCDGKIRSGQILQKSELIFAGASFAKDFLITA